MNLKEVIQQEINAGEFWTAEEKEKFFTEPTVEIWHAKSDEGAIWFYPVEFNHEGIGHQLGTNSWCDKFVLVIPCKNHYVTKQEVERILKLKAFL